MNFILSNKFLEEVAIYLKAQNLSMKTNKYEKRKWLGTIMAINLKIKKGP
jgi:hypothetical protein